ncbi:HNH endonuclease [Agaribacterium sp. ZY112]|uniref:HNH endonuclease n=1 Tax=Agaribacterium sp. ZY112 TaxID=3233574 RepID=UPI003524984B
MAKNASATKRRLFLQGGVCFYCREPLALSDATQDYVIAKSLGGSDGDDNLVVCCRSINQYFVNCSVKMKLDTVLKYRGKLPCLIKGANQGVRVLEI